MNTRRISIIFAFIAVVIIIVLLIGAIYAFFTLEIDDENDINTFNNNTIISFMDTSNVSLTNAYIGENISKTFSVENTGDVVLYYDIKLNDLVNNFSNPDDLVFTLSSSNGGAVIKKTTMPVYNPTIATGIKIEPGIKHSYIMNISFLKTEEDQSNNLNKTFSANIVVSSSIKNHPDTVIYKNGSLGGKIIYNASSELGIGYDTIYGEGLYYTNDTINGNTVYFYRGSKSLNNNLIFGDNCYKILRTTINGGFRIVYNGSVNDGVCSDENSGILEDTSKYNNYSNFNAFVGYMYGSADSSNYLNEHANTNSSVIKTVLDDWYLNNISNYSSYLEDSIYCNNRKTSKFKYKNVVYGLNGFGNNNTGYLSFNNNSVEMKPSLNCINVNDRLSVNNNQGVKALTYPVGLITVDDLTYAGYSNSLSNKDNYLYTDSSYWTMSAAYYNGSAAYNYIVNKDKLGVLKVDSNSGVRPVITLKKDVIVLSGDGSLTSPYRITD